MIASPHTQSLGQVLAGLAAFVGATLLFTWLTTTLSFHAAVKRTDRFAKYKLASRPPVLPYTIPWLGSALAFGSTKVGKFWCSLLARCQRASENLDGASVMLGGTKLHLLYDPFAIKTMFQIRTPRHIQVWALRTYTQCSCLSSGRCS